MRVQTTAIDTINKGPEFGIECSNSNKRLSRSCASFAPFTDNDSQIKVFGCSYSDKNEIEVKSNQMSIQELLEFWKEREPDMQSNNFIDEINAKFDNSDDANNRLDVANFIDPVEMSHPLPVTSNQISFNLGAMMARAEVERRMGIH